MSKQEESDHMLLQMGVGSDDSLAAFAFVITHPTIHVAYEYEILCGPNFDTYCRLKVSQN